MGVTRTPQEGADLPNAGKIHEARTATRDLRYGPISGYDDPSMSFQFTSAVSLSRLEVLLLGSATLKVPSSSLPPPGTSLQERDRGSRTETVSRYTN